MQRLLATITLSLAFLATSAINAEVVVQDSFSYAAGNLVGKTPEVSGAAWAAHSGAGATPVQVTGGAALLAQGGGSREDVNVPFQGGAIAAGETFYAGFDLTVTTTGGSITDVNFAHFLEGTSIFGSRLWITAPTSNGFRLALSGDNSITDNDGEADWGADLSFGTTYRVVSSYAYDTGATSLWINPTSQSSTSIQATDGFASDDFAAYALRQAAGNTGQQIDNLIVATTFNEAAAISAVPEASSFLFGSLIAGVFGAGYVGRRVLRKPA